MAKKKPDERTRKLAELTTRLGADLAAARGNEEHIRALFTAAVASFVAIERAAGAPASASPGELACAEILRDGSGDDIRSPFELAGADDDEYGAWGDILADAAGY